MKVACDAAAAEVRSHVVGRKQHVLEWGRIARSDADARPAGDQFACVPDTEYEEVLAAESTDLSQRVKLRRIGVGREPALQCVRRKSPTEPLGQPLADAALDALQRAARRT